MTRSRSVVISMRLPTASRDRLKHMANRHGWTPSDTNTRLVEEGLRRSEFAFIAFGRMSPILRSFSLCASLPSLSRDSQRQLRALDELGVALLAGEYCSKGGVVATSEQVTTFGSGAPVAAQPSEPV